MGEIMMGAALDTPYNERRKQAQERLLFLSAQLASEDDPRRAASLEQRIARLDARLTQETETVREWERAGLGQRARELIVQGVDLHDIDWALWRLECCEFGRKSQQPEISTGRRKRKTLGIT